MDITPEAFVAQLLEQGLVSSEELDAFLDRLPAERRDGRLETLIKSLVAKKLLTRFQVSRILRGKADSLNLGSYLLQDRIGKGGMGTVYRAEHRWMQRTVALKVISGAQQDPDVLRRFRREVRAAARLIHPNIVTAFDADEHEGQLFLVMEYVEGQNLGLLVANEGPLPLPKAIACMLQASRGLQYAHSQGVIHRDVKPANLLLTSSGQLKILDMGLARTDSRHEHDGSTIDGSFTQQIVGTLDFMSPEQADSSRKADARSDIYALGATFHYLLTGSPPYVRSDWVQILLAHRDAPIPDLRRVRPDVPQGVQDIFARLLAKSPEARPASMAEVYQALAAFDDDSDFQVRDEADPEIEEPWQKTDGETKIFDSLDSPVDAPVPSPTVAISPAAPTVLLGRTNHSDPLAALGIPIGIDLGNDSCTLASLDSRGLPYAIEIAGRASIPAAVYITPDHQIQFGDAALASINLDPAAGVLAAKRTLGLESHERDLRGRRFPNEVLLALLLRHLREQAQQKLGPIAQAVVTVPTHFNELRRVAFQNAGFLAGLEILEILNEQTAAALFYRSHAEASDRPLRDGEHLLLFDLGAGSLDLALLHVQQRNLVTLAVEGDPELGGLDWDRALAQWVAERFRQRHHRDLWTDPLASRQLLQEARQAKHQLSKSAEAILRIQHAGHSFSTSITRTDFQNATSDLLARVESQVDTLLVENGLTWKQIDRLILLGGATRMPMVRRRLAFRWGKEPLPCPQQEEAVALGAALHARNLLAHASGRPDHDLDSFQNVAAHSLGIVVHNPKVARTETNFLIRRNSPIPATHRRAFRTRGGSGSKLSVPLVEGESRNPSDCRPLGRLIVEDLPDQLAAGTPVQVAFTYEANGRLAVGVDVAGYGGTPRIERASGMTPSRLLVWRERLETGELFDPDEIGFAAES